MPVKSSNRWLKLCVLMLAFRNLCYLHKLSKTVFCNLTLKLYALALLWYTRITYPLKSLCSNRFHVIFALSEAIITTVTSITKNSFFWLLCYLAPKKNSNSIVVILFLISSKIVCVGLLYKQNLSNIISLEICKTGQI